MRQLISIHQPDRPVAAAVTPGDVALAVGVEVMGDRRQLQSSRSDWRTTRANHSAPSGPAVISQGPPPNVGMANSATTPAVVILPMLLPAPSVNHNAPSGPAVIPKGTALEFGTGNSVTTPAVVILPMLLPKLSANHSAPSGPAVMLGSAAVWRRNGKFGDDTRSRDPADIAAGSLREPQRAVRTRRDASGRDIGRWNVIFRNNTCRSDPPDLVGIVLSEPQRAVRPHRDASGAAVGRRDRKFGDHAPGGDPPDRARGLFGEPQRAVRTRRDAIGAAVGRGGGNSVTTPAVVIRPIWAISVNHNAPSGPLVIPKGWVFGVGIGNSVMTCAAAAVGSVSTMAAATAPISRIDRLFSALCLRLVPRGLVQWRARFDAAPTITANIFVAINRLPASCNIASERDLHITEPQHALTVSTKTRAAVEALSLLSHSTLLSPPTF